MLNILDIGRLSIFQPWDTVVKSHYGKMYSGQYEEAVDVTILRIDNN